MSDLLQVKARPNEPPDRLIKRFIQKVRSSGIMDELYTRSKFITRAERRRYKDNKAAHKRSKEVLNNGTP
jgi:ribosomal protein S21